MSDSPLSPSGYGNVTRFVCAGLAALGHQVSILGWQDHGKPTAWQGCILYPVRRDTFRADVLLDYLQRLRLQVLVTLADVWCLPFFTSAAVESFRRTAQIRWALYYPIDGDMGGGRLPASWVHVLQTVDLPIAMSAYGRDLTAANGVTPTYIPHGVDATAFRPPAEKTAAKRLLGYDGRFVILSDARNQPRKLLPRTLQIFRRFAAGKPDVLLHLHCDPDDSAARSPKYSYDLRADIEFLGLNDRVRLTPGFSIAAGISLDRLAAIYQSADVHLLASWGEGFGLPTLQAAAAGIVPLAPDYAASRELVLGHGEALRVRHYVQDQFGLRRALIDIDDAVGHLEAYYRDRALLALRAQACRSFAESYSWPRILPHWHDFLEHKAPLRVVENKAGRLGAEVLRDALQFDQMTVPVTLPLAAPDVVTQRTIGCVYAASEADMPVVCALARIFPILNIWSSSALDLSAGLVSGRLDQAKVVPLRSPAYGRHLAGSTLALDLAGADPDLPALAADLGVPCIGLADHPPQAYLWPTLSLARDRPVATELARRVLTDQGEAAEACAYARELRAKGLFPRAAAQGP
jgi:glycosyltransferase involved in cell wall biosynthesis